MKGIKRTRNHKNNWSHWLHLEDKFAFNFLYWKK